MEENLKTKFNKLGNKIKELREEKGMSIYEISLITGIRKVYLQKIENGTAYGFLLERHLLKIANALKVKLHELFIFD